MTAPKLGRPPKLDRHGVATPERLLAAATASCVEHGFDGATVADIAARADVSVPAIYNHFGGKVELLVAAGRAALAQIGGPDGARPRSAADVAEGFLSPGFASRRRLLLELHNAALRHPEVAALLADWQRERAVHWRPAHGADRDVVVKLFFALLLGLCQIDALASMPGSDRALVRRARQLAASLFDDGR